MFSFFSIKASRTVQFTVFLMIFGALVAARLESIILIENLYNRATVKLFSYEHVTIHVRDVNVTLLV